MLARVVDSLTPASASPSTWPRVLPVHQPAGAVIGIKQWQGSSRGSCCFLLEVEKIARSEEDYASYPQGGLSVVRRG